LLPLPHMNRSPSREHDSLVRGETWQRNKS
jgi:hypothetical protein